MWANLGTGGHFNPETGASVCFTQPACFLTFHTSAEEMKEEEDGEEWRKAILAFYDFQQIHSSWDFHLDMHQSKYLIIQTRAGAGLCLSLPLEIWALISLSVICRPSSAGKTDTLSTRLINMHRKDQSENSNIAIMSVSPSSCAASLLRGIAGCRVSVGADV